MIGLDRETGRSRRGRAHLEQSIRDILTTPLGSRVMRGDYGSRLHELVDAPLNPETLADIYSATAEALDRWEPRLTLRRVTARAAAPGGRVSISVEGEYDGETIEAAVTM